jgi:anti-anti-sigma factor
MKKFSADFERIEDISIVRLTGELDANTSVAADDALQNATSIDCKALIVDCRELDYISSAGLGVVLAAMHTCNNKHIKMCMFGLQPKIKNVFSILGIEKIISVTDSEDEAIQSVNGLL